MITVYVKPADLFLGPGYPGTGASGNDANDGLSPTTALATWGGFVAKFASAIKNGERVVLQVIGDGPIDTPTGGRILYTRNIDLDLFGEAWETRFTIRGPRNMYRMTPARTLVAKSNEVENGDLTGRVLLTFDGPMGGAGTYFLTSYRADGRELFWPIPCLGDNGGNGVWISSIAAESITAATRAGDVYYLACPAVHITSDGGDSYFRSVYFTGTGAGRLGDRFGAASPSFDPNYWPLVERCSISRGVFNIRGSFALDACRFSDDAYFLDGEPLLRGCVFEGKCEWQTSGPSLTAASQWVANEMAGGRMLTYNASLGLAVQRYAGVANPDDPVTGCDFGMCGQNAKLVLGHSMGGKPGHYRVLKGIGIYGSGIRVYNGSFTTLKYSRVCMRASAQGDTGLWVLKGFARINSMDPLWNYQTNPSVAIYAGTRISGTTNHLRVGFGAAIPLGSGQGQFGDTASWNGVFTRRHQLSANGYPNDLSSEIWDVYKEPTGFDPGI